MPRVTKKSAESAPAPAPAVVEPVSNVVVDENTITAPPADDTTLADAFTDAIAQLNGLRTQITALSTHLRSLRARADREIRAAQKASKKRKATNRKPSGFVKPMPISDELASFLGEKTGTELARTQVTKRIVAYIREHKLNDPQNGRRILADTKLRKLLKLGKNDELTYFNLQKYMSPHFPKSATAVAASS